MNGAVFKSVLIDDGKEKAHTLSFPAALPPSPGWASWEGGREKVHVIKRFLSLNVWKNLLRIVPGQGTKIPQAV